MAFADAFSVGSYGWDDADVGSVGVYGWEAPAVLEAVPTLRQVGAGATLERVTGSGLVLQKNLAVSAVLEIVSGSGLVLEHASAKAEVLERATGAAVIAPVDAKALINETVTGNGRIP